MNINIPDKIDINRLGENITLEESTENIMPNIEPDFTQMFKTCSCVQGIEGDDVVFTDGTRVPISQIGVPMHDSSFYKPSYVETNERIDTYKKIFLTVLPTILRRESYPFNFDRIIDLSNEITVKTMRQFTKMKNYYSEHI